MKPYILFSMLFCCASGLYAQGWQQWYGGPGNERLLTMAPLPDGRWLLAGTVVDSGATASDNLLLLTNADAQVQISRRWGSPDSSESLLQLFPLPAGEWLAAGNAYFTAGANPQDLRGDMCWWRLTPDGQPLERHQGTQPYGQMRRASAGPTGFWLAGSAYHTQPGGALQQTALLRRLLPDGSDIAWTFECLLGQGSEATDVLPLPDGSALACGWWLDAAAQYQPFVCRIDATGAVTDTLWWQTPNGFRAEQILQAIGNQYRVTGRYASGASSQETGILALTPSLDSLWLRAVAVPGAQIPHDARVLSDGRILLCGEHIAPGSSSRDAFLLLCDTAAQLQTWQTYGGPKGDIAWQLAPAAGNHWVLCGQTASFNDGSLDGWWWSVDSTGALWRNQLQGRVVWDTQQNCLPDSAEAPLNQWLVRASGAGAQVYATTDSQGQYAMALDSGQWFVSVLPPNGYWAACFDSLEIQLHQTDTLALDFPVQSAYACPLMYVDVSIPFLRRCFNNTYILRYENFGTAPAQQVRIALAPDPFLSVQSAGWPYTTSGDTLWFELGDVPAFSGGSFPVTFLLDCDSTQLGQTHCTEAWIFPDSLCAALNPVWDGANLEVSGYCAGDSVVLRVQNTGLPMSGTASFLIVEDQIIFKQSALQLDAGEDTLFVLYPQGATVTLVVQQSPGHPVSVNPTLVIEGCGATPFSTGWAQQFPNDDGSPFSDTECRASVGSYDPNDKIAFPQGVGPEHLISATAPLEYLIRFQNTGTDTAFRVEIRDTLPLALDPSTLEMGASSHPMRWDLLGRGILRWRFDPIALPDSAASQAGSQGFVKFRIQPFPGQNSGVRMENHADIYFDYNAPVRTASTWHTLGSPGAGLTTTVPAPISGNTAGAIRLFPNPASRWVRVLQTTGELPENGTFFLYNTLGQTVLQTRLLKNGSIDLNGLPAGVFMAALHDAAGVLLHRSVLVVHP